jgi:hypothetical protein
LKICKDIRNSSCTAVLATTPGTKKPLVFGVVDTGRKFTAVSTTLAVSHYSRNLHWLQPTTVEVALPPVFKYEKTSV